MKNAKILIICLPLVLAAITTLITIPTVGATCPPNPDFFITATPNLIQVIRPANPMAIITVTSNCGFSGTVNLSANVSPSNPPPFPPTTSLFAPSVTVVSNGVGFSTLTINVASNTNPRPNLINPYIITVTGMGGGNIHSVSITLTVAP